jgi:proline iminopeptidase
MQIEVNGTRLWFDVEGAGLVPGESAMVARPYLLLVHGGPGTYDHSYFKPHFAALTRCAQVIYVDLRDHGRSARHRAADWSFELCADDLAALCAALGIVRPFVLGHSMGGFVALLLAARHPDLVGGLVLQSTMARFDLERLVSGFRRAAGDEIAALARRDYAGDSISDAEWERVFRAFGPVVPDAAALGRRIRNLEVAAHGMDLMRRMDLRGELGRVACPVLVSVGDLDPVTPVEAAREIAAGLAPGTGRLDVLERAGHFPWLDRGEDYWSLVGGFIASRR